MFSVLIQSKKKHEESSLVHSVCDCLSIRCQRGGFFCRQSYERFVLPDVWVFIDYRLTVVQDVAFLLQRISVDNVI